MSLYEFHITHCEKTFELLAAQSDELRALLCPSCRSPEISNSLA